MMVSSLLAPSVVVQRELALVLWYRSPSEVLAPEVRWLVLVPAYLSRGWRSGIFLPSAGGLACSCALSTWRNGVAGLGCCSAQMRSCAACVAASCDVVRGMVQCCGKNSTVLPIRSAAVVLVT